MMRLIARIVLGGAIFSLFGAATCVGKADVFEDPALNRGSCILVRPVNQNPPVSVDEELQIADSENVNDFIRCHVLTIQDRERIPAPEEVQYRVYVSPGDAAGHSFVVPVNGTPLRPGIVDNLSR